MSTNVAHPGTGSGSGRSGKFLGLAVAGLAVVITAGFVFALNRGNEPTKSGVQPADSSVSMESASHPTVNIERYRLEKAGLIGTSSPSFSVIGGATNQVPAVARVPEVDPTLNIEKYKLETAGVIGNAQSPTLNIEKYRIDLQNAERATNIAAQRYEEYAKLLAEQAQAQAVKQQAMWDQRFDDMVERFENQAGNGTGLRPLQGRS